MSYPSRQGLAGMPGIPPMGMPFMNVPGVPPPSMPMGMPPNMLSGPPPGPNPFFGIGGPPPRSGPPPNHGQNRPNNNSHIITGKSTVQLPSDHPSPIQMKNVPMGPPVTVFVGNITDKWPDAMIRQLLATCGHVLNWKRVQGASGKLQGFGFCEFNGPDAGLRAVRLLHDIEVGDKKLVVKVDAKTSTVLEEFKADRKKKKDEDDKDVNEADDSKEVKHDQDSEDYMDQEMAELDERSRMRISILFREFKNELESYIPPGGNEKPEKDPGSKQAIQDKLHLLKLTSLDAPPSDADASDDLAVEEGKREIITQEISKFREHMKQEKEKEDERKRLGRERREREKEREERDKIKRERGSKSPSSRRRERGRSKSPSKRTSQPRSPSRGKNRSRSRSKANADSLRNRDRDRDSRSRRDRDRNDTPRDRVDRDRGNRDRRRSRSPIQRFRNSRDRERSPIIAPHKRRYREREEEEEVEEQRKLDKKAREKEQAYDERLRRWEEREMKKAREAAKDKERRERIEDEVFRDARKMKQFLEDYDDEKMDPKYYKGKELQKRLSDRARELEVDNKDRQREREEIEEMRLKMLTSGTSALSGTIPVITLDRPYKKPMMDSTNTSVSSSPSQFQQLSNKLAKSPIALSTGNTVAARLLAMAGQGPSQSANQTQNPTVSQNNGISTFPRREAPAAARRPKTPPPPPKIDFMSKQVTPDQAQNPQTEFNSIHFPSFVPIKVRSSNPSTPNSLTSPAAPPELSPSLKSLANTGFQLTMNNNSNASSSLKAEEDDTRHSFSSPNSPGMASPGNYGRDDDSSLQDMSPDFGKKKKMDVKDIFNQDEDDDGFGSARKRTLVPLDYGDAKLKKEEKVLEDKKKHVKSLIDRIPTEKDALFAYEIDWSMVDNTLMEKRIRPWINKKIIEYIGEPEPTLVEFICTKVLAQSEPTAILEDVQMVLDEEAEVFVVKMWRLLIYEIEAKKIGVASAIKTN